MGFYRNHILPHLITFAMSNKDLAPYRRRVVSAARGRVLEIGIGSAPNLSFYSDSVEEIIGLDPSPELLEMARRRGQQTGRRLDLMRASAEAIPLESGSISFAQDGKGVACQFANEDLALDAMPEHVGLEAQLRERRTRRA
jgi:hypothetical protein